MTIENVKDIFRPIVKSKLAETDEKLPQLFEKVSGMIKRFVETNRHFSGFDDFLQVSDPIEAMVLQIEKRYAQITT